LGGVLNIWADHLFKRDETTVKPYKRPTVLEDSGPFRISRHPMYLGMTSILVGAAILLGTIITFITPLLFILLVEILFLRDEEKNLEEAFGDEFLDYKMRVGRWI
jgi:protein-S-isoprenylcysteine O-methyltransferase Ste14